MSSQRPLPQVVFVTGPSGAGRHTALNALEDLAFETVDNIPLSLVPHMLDRTDPERPLALGIDGRNRDFAPDAFLALVGATRQRDDLAFQVLYLDCDYRQLLRRFSETRRRHPLAPTQAPDIGIRAELSLFASIKDSADLVVDTTDMSPHDLRSEIDKWFASPDGGQMAISIESFSYKRGVPRGLDLVFDVRFLRNPHWDEALRPLTGQTQVVQTYVSEDVMFAPFRTRVQELMLMLLPAYRAEGKSHLSIGLGCTGGQHRSVAVAETLAQGLADAGWNVSVRHRELERRGLLDDGAKAEVRT